MLFVLKINGNAAALILKAAAQLTDANHVLPWGTAPLYQNFHSSLLLGTTFTHKEIQEKVNHKGALSSLMNFHSSGKASGQEQCSCSSDANYNTPSHLMCTEATLPVSIWNLQSSTGYFIYNKGFIAQKAHLSYWIVETIVTYKT